jgi:hypothetical protein
MLTPPSIKIIQWFSDWLYNKVIQNHYLGDFASPKIVTWIKFTLQSSTERKKKDKIHETIVLQHWTSDNRSKIVNLEKGNKWCEPYNCPRLLFGEGVNSTPNCNSKRVLLLESEKSFAGSGVGGLAVSWWAFEKWLNSKDSDLINELIL